jgi:hypothetical protein
MFGLLQDAIKGQDALAGQMGDAPLCRKLEARKLI